MYEASENSLLEFIVSQEKPHHADLTRWQQLDIIFSNNNN